MSTLADDILPDVSAMAEYTYGSATPTNVRRIRHLIAEHNFPAKKIGCTWESKKSWINALYAEPDSRNGGSK